MEKNLGRTLPILMYHHIAKPSSSVKVRGLYVTPQQFDWQIRWLKQAGFEFINFRKLAEQAKSVSSQIPPRQIILTFDDGYADNYRNAFPILKQYGITAVIYPVVGDLGKQQVVWPKNDEQRPVDLMTENEIQEMSQAGIEFGSHLMNHIHLARQNPKAIREQLSRSKDVLEGLLDTPILSVAYPFGDYNSEVLEATAQVGYQYGVTTVSGANEATQPCLELKRVSIKGHKFHHRWRFMRQLRGLA